MDKWVDGRPVKPTRHDNESPVDYFKRTKCCPDDYMGPFGGKFYCNPAHCSRAFDSEADRDRHLDMAYAILG